MISMLFDILFITETVLILFCFLSFLNLVYGLDNELDVWILHSKEKKNS